MDKEPELVRDDMGRPWPRIVVGVPPFFTGAPSAEIFFDFLNVAQYGWPFIRIPCMPCDRALQFFAEHLMANQFFSHLCILAADHRHPQNVVQRLARVVIDDPERLFVVGLNFRRHDKHDPLSWILDDKGERLAVQKDSGLVKLDMGHGGITGHGSALIAREVFERIPPPWFRFINDAPTGHEWLGEDTYLSRKCNEHGIVMWCDTGLVSPHRFDSYADGSQYEQYVKDHPEEVVELIEIEQDWVTRRQDNGS